MAINNLLQTLEMANISGEIASIIRGEIKNGASDFKLTTDTTALLQDDVKINKYQSDYDTYLASIRQKISDENNDILLLLDKVKLDGYLNDSFRSLKKSTGGKYVDELLAPVFKKSINGFATDALGNIPVADMNNLINAGLSYLKQQGVDVTHIPADENLLSDKFQTLKSQVSENILNDSLFSKLSSDATKLIDSHQANPTDTGNLNTFIQEFESLRATANTIVNQSFADLGTEFGVLANNEKIVYDKTTGVLSKFLADINNRSSKISVLEDQIKNILTITNKPADVLADLAQKQVAHAGLVAANLFQTNVITKYLKEGVNIISSVESYKTTAVNLLSDAEGELTRFTTGLDTLKNNPTLSGITTFASNTIGEIGALTKALTNLNVAIPVGVAKFLNYANVAISVATALLPPNPIGIIGALGSLGGLFGGGGPSLEEQMFKAMNEGFNKVQQTLSDIENQINQLGDMIQKSYTNIMKSLEVISVKLDTIAAQLNLTDAMIQFLIYKDYNLADKMISYRSALEGDMNLALLKAWYDVNIAVNSEALTALLEFVSSPENLDIVTRADFKNQMGGNTDVNIKFYNSTLRLINSIWHDITDNEKNKNIFSIPAQKNNTNLYLDGSNIVNSTKYYDFLETTQNYFDPEYISKLAIQYITLQPFFILSKDELGLPPIANIEDLIAAQTGIKNKITVAKDNLHNLLAQINKATIQQTILSGGPIMLSIKNALQDPSIAYYADVITAINSNELLAKNTAVFILGLLIHEPAKIATLGKLYYQVVNDISKLNDLNALLGSFGNGKLQFKYDNIGDPSNLHSLLYLKYTNTVNADTAILPLPTFEIIQNQQMIYNNGMYTLLSAKEKVLTAITDIVFFQQLENNQNLADTYKQIFFSQTIQQTQIL